MNTDKLKAELTQEEGDRLTAYLDSLGILSVGIGHNCIAQPVVGVNAPGDTITAEHEHNIFLSDCDEAIKELDAHLPWWSQLDDVRQNVLLDMCFNMGIKSLLTFHNTLAAIEAGEYEIAVKGMRSSRWAVQVGKRAVRLEQMMLTGNWPTDIKEA